MHVLSPLRKHANLMSDGSPASACTPDSNGSTTGPAFKQAVQLGHVLLGVLFGILLLILLRLFHTIIMLRIFLQRPPTEQRVLWHVQVIRTCLFLILRRLLLVLLATSLQPLSCRHRQNSANHPLPGNWSREKSGQSLCKSNLFVFVPPRLLLRCSPARARGNLNLAGP